MLVIDSESVKPADRSAALEAVFNSREVPQRVRYVVPSPAVRHRAEFFGLGPGVHLFRNMGTGVEIVRGPREVRRGAPEQLAVCFQGRGSGQLDCDEGRLVKGPGELSLQDTTRPYGYRQSEGTDHKVLLVDPALLILPVDLVRRAAHRLSASPLYPLVRTHFAGLCADSTDLPTEAAARLGRATVELVAAMITTAVDDPRQRQALEDSLLSRVTMYIDAHLADPGLGPEQIAAAHHVSVRHLYRVWERSGRDAPPAEWILRRRLDRARSRLVAGGSDPDTAPPTVRALAHGSGFVNASHFTRQFRHVFGMTPTEWRRSHGAGT